MPSSQHVNTVCVFNVTLLKTSHFLPGFMRKRYQDKTGQRITQHETEVIITYLGSYPEVEYPPSSLCVDVFQPQLAKDENLHRKDLQAEPASDQRHTVEKPCHQCWISSRR